MATFKKINMVCEFYFFSDDAKNLECKKPFTIHVKNVILKAGAEFIVVLTGKIKNITITLQNAKNYCTKMNK